MGYTENYSTSETNKNRHIFYDDKLQKKLIQKSFSCYSKAAFEKIKASNISGIPKITDLSEKEDTLFVTEEFIEGNNLEEIMKSGKIFTEKEARDIILEVCKTLSCLHKIDPPIVHRDIKPSNIMISREGKIYLVDFDAAKTFSPNECRDTVLIGTAGFAAPEQYGFMSSNPRTDIYSLGSTFNFILTGAFPNEHLSTGQYEPIISKATEMDPKNRFSSVDEMIDEINKIEKGKKNPSRFLSPLLPLLFIAILLLSLVNPAEPTEIPDEPHQNLSEAEAILYHGMKVNLETESVKNIYPTFNENLLLRNTVLPFSDSSQTYYLGIKDLTHGGNWYFGGSMGLPEPRQVALDLIPWIFTKEDGILVPLSEKQMELAYEYYDFTIYFSPNEKNAGSYYPFIRSLNDSGSGHIQVSFDESSSGLWIVSCEAISKDTGKSYQYFSSQEFTILKIHSYDLSEETTIQRINQRISEIIEEASAFDISTNIEDVFLAPGTYDGILSIPSGKVHLRIMAKDFEKSGKRIELKGGLTSNCELLDIKGFDFKGAGKDQEFWGTDSEFCDKPNVGIYGKGDISLFETTLSGYYIARDSSDNPNSGNFNSSIQNCHIGLYLDVGKVSEAMELNQMDFTDCDVAIRIAGTSASYDPNYFRMENIVFSGNGQDIVNDAKKEQ